MNYSIEVTKYFSKQLKRLVKKYPSLKSEYALLIDSLKQNPIQGSSLNHNCYKIRISISSKGKGKRSGGRLITHIQSVNNKVYMLSIYDKSEQPDISKMDLIQWLDSI